MVESTALTHPDPFLQHYVWILEILVLMESFLLLWEQHCYRKFVKTHLSLWGHDKVNRSREKRLCVDVPHKKMDLQRFPFFPPVVRRLSCSSPGIRRIMEDELTKLD